jgi:hypothetical protein
MKLFSCDHCGNTIYFENDRCQHCGHALGYVPGHNALISLDPVEGGWAALAFPGKTYLYCSNAQHGACNWLIEAEPGGPVFCSACRHNETIPPLDGTQNLQHWQVIERAKKRLFYSLLRLDLPLATRAEDPEHGLAFRFLADTLGAANPVMTGHENGIITISLAEADDAERERRRANMGEPYRTLLGHFRHEIGHHYWDLLIDGKAPQDQFRALFGDERADYGAALQAYYANGAPLGWHNTHISAYATAHPWEDFAETFAHYLHITDTVEMAAAFGIRAKPRTGDESLALPQVRFDPYMAPAMSDIVDNWIPLSLLMNNLNRAMGQTDAYPFVLTPAIVEKLSFVNDLVHQSPALDQLGRLGDMQ